MKIYLPFLHPQYDYIFNLLDDHYESNPKNVTNSLGRALILHDWWPYTKRTGGHRHTQREDCEDTGRRQLSMGPGARPQNKASLLTP